MNNTEQGGTRKACKGEIYTKRRHKTNYTNREVEEMDEEEQEEKVKIRSIHRKKKQILVV